MSKPNETTLVMAEDHHLVRQGLGLLLRGEAGMRVMGEASDGIEAVELASKYRPDVLLLDLMIPRLHGLEVTRQVKRDFPEVRIIILSMHKEESYVIEALRNGASGYVLKDATGTDLVEAIRKVKAGQRYLSPALAELAFSMLEQKAADSAGNVYESLTSRERLVLQLAAEGCTSGEIAQRLSISQRTVETHRSNLLRKLGLRSQTDLVRFAIRKGIIPA